MRILIYTGKGGVGKTRVAAATAYLLAAEGKRTLIVSTDVAHSLSDSLHLPLDSEPIQVDDRLWAQEISDLKGSAHEQGSVREGDASENVLRRIRRTGLRCSLYEVRTEEIRRTENGYKLRIAIPYADGSG